MKFLIAGLGSIGRRHLRNLIALGERDILLYRTSLSTLPDDELKDYPVETNLDSALSHTPEAVIVSNPTAMHLDVAIPAAEAGCHIFMEKPISHSLERMEEFRAMVKHRGVKVLVGYQFRFHPGLATARRLISEGSIGRPLSIHAHWGEYLPDWHPWEDYRQSYSARAELGGGVMLTLSHPIDYSRWLVGEITEVWAFTTRTSELMVEVEDIAEIGFRFDNGVLGSLHLDYNQRPPSHHLEVIGTEGTIQWDYSDGVTEVYREKEQKWSHYPTPLNYERNDMFLAEMQHFCEVVKGREDPMCTLEDGLKTLEIVLAAQSSQTQRKTIQLPLL